MLLNIKPFITDKRALKFQGSLLYQLFKALLFPTSYYFPRLISPLCNHAKTQKQQNKR